MNGVVGAVTGASFALAAGFITTTTIKKQHGEETSGDPSSLFHSLGYAAVSGVICGTFGGIISHRTIRDYGFVGGTSAGIVAGIASGAYGTWDFL